MKRYLLLLALATSCLWAKSSIITTHGTDCSVATNCLVASLVQDQGGATLVLSGTWTGTIQFEATGDGGATWASVNVLPLNSTTAVTSATANGTWQVNIAGFTGLRMRSSASMTGSATATITPSAASARSNGGGGGGGGSVSLTATTPVVITPSPTTGTGVISCPTCQTGAPGTVFACSTISSGSPAWGNCYVTLTAAQINGATTPVTLIAAQGTNVLINVTNITAEYIYGSLPFVDTESTFIYILGIDSYNAGLTDWMAWAGPISNASFLTQLSNQVTGTFGLAAELSGSFSQSSAFVNQPLQLYDDTGATSGGTGSSVEFWITYNLTTLQ